MLFPSLTIIIIMSSERPSKNNPMRNIAGSLQGKLCGRNDSSFLKPRKKELFELFIQKRMMMLSK
jgi:hypothetical protein